MHLFLEFRREADGKEILLGEGTDYVGPWNLAGTLDRSSRQVEWVKKYVRRHSVRYQGLGTERGIIGQWTISGLLKGQFHIWPRVWGDLDEQYLSEELKGSLPPQGRPGILGAGNSSGSGQAGPSHAVPNGWMEPAFPCPD